MRGQQLLPRFGCLERLVLTLKDVSRGSARAVIDNYKMKIE